MDVAEPLERLRCERVDVVLETDVSRDRDHVGARLRELVRSLFEHGPLDVGEHDPHALGGEPLGERADARRGPGDDRDLAGEVFHDQVRRRYAEWSRSVFLQLLRVPL